MRERLKTCYKILHLVLLVFTDLNLELLHYFVHFWSSYGKTLVQYGKLVVMKISEICPIVKRLMKLIFDARRPTNFSTLHPGPAAALGGTAGKSSQFTFSQLKEHEISSYVQNFTIKFSTILNQVVVVVV